MRWTRGVSGRTVKIITLTAFIFGIVIYDYNYVRTLPQHTDQREGGELFEDIEINNEISYYFDKQKVPSAKSVSSSVRIPHSPGAGYVRAIEEILTPEITPAKHIKSQSARHINLGLILINLQTNTTELSKKFSKKVSKAGSSFIVRLYYFLVLMIIFIETTESQRCDGGIVDTGQYSDLLDGESPQHHRGDGQGECRECRHLHGEDVDEGDCPESYS